MWSSTALLLLTEILFCILAFILTFPPPSPLPLPRVLFKMQTNVFPLCGFFFTALFSDLSKP